MPANQNKVKRDAERSTIQISLNNKRKVFWVSSSIAVGSLIGAYFFPPILALSGVSLVAMVSSFRSIDLQMRGVIKSMKPAISLEELVQDGFPEETKESKERLIKQPQPKNHQDNVSIVSNEIWAHQVLFSDASRVSALSPSVDVKNDPPSEDKKDRSVYPQGS